MPIHPPVYWATGLTFSIGQNGLWKFAHKVNSLYYEQLIVQANSDYWMLYNYTVEIGCNDGQMSDIFWSIQKIEEEANRI